MLELKIAPGNIVFIDGKRRTVAKVWRLMVSDWHQGKVRIDTFTRKNAGVSIGDGVKISIVGDEIEAKKVILAPPADLPNRTPLDYPGVRNRLVDFPLVKD